MKSIIPSVKGTRDFYPEVMRNRQWLYQCIRFVSEAYGYQEWDAPFLERIDLYAAKSGDELVKEQAFVFPDRGGDLLTLRPELTPSLARMVAQRQQELVFPLRWWSFGPFWRYERPQKGRTREFFQWNIDLIGVNSPEADAEMLSIAAAFLAQVGLMPDQVVIRVNSRALMGLKLAEIGVPPDLKTPAFRLIDRKDKLSPEGWEANGIEIGLSADQIEKLKGILANKELWRESAELLKVFSILAASGQSDYFEYDPVVVRGLDYYTGVVFESYARKGGRAILGGGRYNNLVSDVGGEPLASLGFAMGDVMISVLLNELGLFPSKSALADTVLVTIFDESLSSASAGLAAELRQVGFKASLYPEAAKLPKQLKYADRMGIRFAVILGPDEAANEQVLVKDLAARTQKLVSRVGFIAEMRAFLAQA